MKQISNFFWQYQHLMKIHMLITNKEGMFTSDMTSLKQGSTISGAR